MPLDDSLAFLTKKDAVAEHLRGEILAGAHPPGTSLHQSDVANRLGVSPTPVREAFQTLASEGLLEIHPHRGAVVAEQTFTDIEDIYELRVLFEVAALRRAMAHLDDGVLERLDQILDDAKLALTPRPDEQLFRRTSALFHREIVNASGSRIYAGIAEMLIRRSTYFIALEGPRMREIYREHVQLVDLLRRKDAGRAVSLMQEHMGRNLRLRARRRIPRGSAASAAVAPSSARRVRLAAAR